MAGFKSLRLYVLLGLFALWLPSAQWNLVSLLMAYSRLDVVKYLELTPEQRQKLEKQYVKQKDGQYTLKLQTYEVISDTSAEKTLEMAVLMDDFYRQFSSKFTGAFKKNQIPRVYVMANKKSYEKAIYDFSKLTAPEWSAGLFVSYKTGGLFCNMDHGEESLGIMKHEGTHQLLDAYIDGPIPVWFNEGTATVFETFQMDQSMLTNVQMNLFNSNYPQLFSKEGESQRISVQKLFAIDGNEWGETKDPSLQYASAWVVVNYLLTTDNGLKLYNKVLSALRSKQKLTNILSPKTLEDLDKNVANHTNMVIQHAKFGRKIELLHKNKRFSDMLSAAQAYLSKFPDSLEAQFYNIFSRLCNPLEKEINRFDDQKMPENSGLDPAANAKNIREAITKNFIVPLSQLEKNGYGHPQMDYAYMLAHQRAGNKDKEDYYYRVLLANMPRHPGILADQNKK